MEFPQPAVAGRGSVFSPNSIAWPGFWNPLTFPQPGLWKFAGAWRNPGGVDASFIGRGAGSPHAAGLPGMSVVAALPAPLAVLVADRQPLAGGVAGDGTGATAVAGPGPPPQPGLPTAAAVLARPGAVAALLAHPALQPDAAAARALGDGLARLAQLLGQEAVPGAVTTAPAAALVRRLAGIAIAALPAAVASDRLLAALGTASPAPATASPTAGDGTQAGMTRHGAPTAPAEAVAAGPGADAAGRRARRGGACRARRRPRRFAARSGGC
ncbi:MAG: hypothetical protein U1E14_17185 [Geminicoccaceae bacterium]